MQLHHLRAMRPEAVPDYVLVVNVENTTRTVDYADRRTAVLWGDGSSAAVVSARIPAPVRRPVKRRALGSGRVGQGRDPAGGHFIQEGPAVQGFAIRKSIVTLTSSCAHLARDRRGRCGSSATRPT